MRFWQLKNLKEFVEAVCLSEKRLFYFYPKASTPGCTAEACSLRDNYDRFLAAGYNVVGISRDSVKAQKNFSDKNALPFPPQTVLKVSYQTL